MSYGSTEWLPWSLDEEEGLKHIKAAWVSIVFEHARVSKSFSRYDAGIQTFDTANMYSHGLSERILGKANKKYNIPRDKMVILTKVFSVVGQSPADKLLRGDRIPEE